MLNMDKEQLCNEILKIDDKIRFTGIYDEGKFHHKMREGLDSHLTLEETVDSLAQVEDRWASRKKAAPKLGEPLYAMAKYAKAYRITFPIGKAGLIIVTTELTANPEEIAVKVTKLRDDNYQLS